MAPSVKVRGSLVDVAMGRKPADRVLRGGQWVCVQSGEIIPNTDIAITAGRIAYVGEDSAHTIGAETEIIDAGGRYIVPGLLDAHVHVESSMMTITEFVRAVVPNGTTGIFIDPHEIANIFGLRGVRLMVNEAARQPIHVWVQMPSCVPSAPKLETSGGSISAEEVKEAMTWPGIIGLGEMMNFPGVCNGDKKLLTEMWATQAARKTVGGHYPSTDLGISFHGYVAGGEEDDHEGTRREDAIARVRQGMRSMLRYGSAWQDVASQVGAITQDGLDPRRFILCTDDVHAQTLASEGHMDRVIRHAVAKGLSPMAAIQMATINTAEHFGLSLELGMIAPGRWADILLVENLNEFQPGLVIAKGQVLAKERKVILPAPEFKYPLWVTKSVHLDRPIQPRDFILKYPQSASQLRANVIGVIENQAPTQHVIMAIQTEDGEVKADLQRDIAKLAVIRRHQGLNGISLGLVNGFGFTAKCAVASTVAHDCHHLIVAGTDDANMALAVNELARNGGGQIVVKDEQVIGMVNLTIGGLMSSDSVEVVAGKTESVLEGFRLCGCKLNNPNMQLSLLALVVIPELRLSDKGLVDVERFDFIPILEKA